MFFSADGEDGLGAGDLQPDSLLLTTTVLSHFRSGCKHTLIFHQVHCEFRLLNHQHRHNYLTYLLFVPCTQDCQVGLNFSMQQEAEDFRHAVEDKITQRNTRQGQ